MNHPTTRVLALLEILQAAGPTFHAGPELAARLSVDPRTVRHYLRLLEDIGIPLEAARGRYGGYRLRPGFKLPPLMFSEEEAVALTLGLRFAVRQGLTLAAPAVESARAKVERVLPAVLRERVQAVQAGVVFGDAAPPYPAPPNDLIATVSAAVHARRRIRLSHLSFERREGGAREMEERDVDPYAVVCYGGRWYLVGHCHRREAVRVFRLDRANAAELLPAPLLAPPPPDFDALSHVQRAMATTPGTFAVEVLLLTTLEEAQQRISPALATLEEIPNGVLLRCHVQRLRWFAHYLVGLEFALEIRNPPELCEAVRDLGERALRLAGGTDSSR